MRTFRLSVRNPVVAIAIIMVMIVLVAVLMSAGLILLTGAAIVGGIGLALRRVLGTRSLPAPRRLDPELEVFAATPVSGEKLGDGVRIER